MLMGVLGSPSPSLSTANEYFHFAAGLAAGLWWVVRLAGILLMPCKDREELKIHPYRRSTLTKGLKKAVSKLRWTTCSMCQSHVWLLLCSSDALFSILRLFSCIKYATVICNIIEACLRQSLTLVHVTHCWPVVALWFQTGVYARSPWRGGLEPEM